MPRVNCRFSVKERWATLEALGLRSVEEPAKKQAKPPAPTDRVFIAFGGTQGLEAFLYRRGSVSDRATGLFVT